MEIWSEGFIASGQSEGACFHGCGIGDTFKECCDELANRNEEFKKHYNRESMTHWGCKLYSDEKLARESYG